MNYYGIIVYIFSIFFAIGLQTKIDRNRVIENYFLEGQRRQISIGYYLIRNQLKLGGLKTEKQLKRLLEISEELKVDKDQNKMIRKDLRKMYFDLGLDYNYFQSDHSMFNHIVKEVAPKKGRDYSTLKLFLANLNYIGEDEISLNMTLINDYGNYYETNKVSSKKPIKTLLNFYCNDVMIDVHDLNYYYDDFVNISVESVNPVTGKNKFYCPKTD